MLGNLHSLAKACCAFQNRGMQTENATAQILDLTNPQVCYELAVEAEELFGRKGAKLIADLKERAGEAEYTHMYYRDPMRPGIMWFSALNNQSLPARGKLELCRSITERVFPNFLNSLDPENAEEIMSQIPPISYGVNALDLATALEYLVFVHPSMVRAWAALIFAYGEMLKMPFAADATRQDCIGTCPHAQVVMFLISGNNPEADETGGNSSLM